MERDPDQDIADFGYDRDTSCSPPGWTAALRRDAGVTFQALGWRLMGREERARNLIGSLVGQRLKPRTISSAQRGSERAATFAPADDKTIVRLKAGTAGQGEEFVVLSWPRAAVQNDIGELVSAAFSESPGVAAIYFDEMATASSRPIPLQKPPFDEDMLLAVDYVGSCLAVRRSVLADLGGIPENRPGAELRQLALAVSAKFGAHAVGRLPVVVTRLASSASSDSRSGKREARCQVSADYLALKGVDADCILDDETGNVHVHRKLPNPPPRVSIIVPTHDRLDLLRPCLESISQVTDYRGYELIIADHESRERETADYLKLMSSRDRVSVLRMDGPFNYSRINNAAARRVTGEVLVFLNNDTQVLNADWLKELVVHAIRPEIGAVGAKLFYPDGRIQHGGINIGGPAMAQNAYRYFPGDHAGYMHRLRVPHRADAVTAACMAVSAEKLAAVGGFDEVAFPVAYNDVDLCLKLEQAGLINLWTPYAKLIHKEQATRGDMRDAGEAAAFARKWRDRLAKAPVNPIDA